MRGKSRQHVVESRQHVVDSMKDSREHIEESRLHVVDSIQGKKSLHTAYCLLPTKKNSLSTVYRLLSTEKKSLPTTYCILPTEKGFTLVELMITMVIFVLVIAAASQIFTGLLTQFKQQSKIAETNIEGIVGLEMLRQDIAHAGYGLPWVIPSDVTYTAAETFSATPCGTGTTANPTTFNDSTPNAPRAVVSGNNTCLNGSDYLVIKAINVATNNTSNKWALLGNTGVLRYDISGDAFNTSDRVVVLDPGTSDATMRTLVGSGSTFYKQYSAVTDFNPSDSTTTRFIYGIRDGAAPKVPLNRADYYISIPATMPSQCAVGTGVLYKATMNHGSISEGNQFTELPLLDCVADMQVIYRLDMNEDGTIGTTANADGSTITSNEGATAATVQATFADASLLRRRVKEVRVYILAHEGQKDSTYTSAAIIIVNDPDFGNIYAPAAGFAVPDLNYRWKVYTLVVKPMDLYK